MKHTLVRRATTAIAGAVALTALTAGAASAHECVNASKQNQDAGVQIVFSEANFEPVWISKGLQQRIDSGLVDLETGEGFRGLLGIDFDGDAVADVSIWVVGPYGALPHQAQENGAECRGVVNIEDYFACIDS